MRLTLKWLPFPELKMPYNFLEKGFRMIAKFPNGMIAIWEPDQVCSTCSDTGIRFIDSKSSLPLAVKASMVRHKIIFPVLNELYYNIFKVGI